MFDQYNNYVALNVNDQKQSIQNVQIANKNTFQRVKFILEDMTHETGIAPSTNDVKNFIYYDKHPSNATKKSIKQLDKDMALDAQR